jgi:hypothetical protein
MRKLRQSTSVDVPIGPFLDATDGVTAETGLTLTQPDIRLKKGNAAWAQKAAAQTLSHEENGFYEVTLDATDTNTVGLLRLAVHESGALPVWEDFEVLSAAVYDWFFGTSAPLMPTVAGRTLDVSATGEAGIDWANVGSPTTTLNLSGTTVKTATDVETDTADIQGRLPAALVSGRIDASVGAMAANTLTASALAADAVTEIQSGLSTLDAAGIRTAVGLATANLDTQLTAIDDYLDTEVAAIKAKTDNLPTDPADASVIAGLIATAQAVLDKLDDTLEDDAGTYRFTTNALEQAPSGGGGGTDWTADERTALRTILGIPASGTTPDAPSAGALKVIDDFLDTEVAAILADTNELQTDLADGGRLDALIDAIKAKTDNLPTDPADASVIAARFDTVDSAIDNLTFPGVPDNFEFLSISANGVVKGFPSELDGTAIEGQALSVNEDGQIEIDLTQAVPTSNTAQTVGDALNAARADGFGDSAIVDLVQTLYAGDGTTPVRQFTLDRVPNPRSRTGSTPS